MKSDSLFELIQSLTKNEKRAFQLSAQKHGTARDKDYMELFHYFSSLNVYQREIVEPLLKKQFSNLAYTKNYLHDFILKTLRAYHSGQTVAIQLDELMIDIRILVKKGLKHQAEKLIQKGKKLALKYEEDVKYLEFLILERKQIRRDKKKKIREMIEAVQEESGESLKKITQFLNILKVYEEVFIGIKTDNEIKAESDRLMQQKVLGLAEKLPSEDISLDAAIYLLGVSSHYYYQQGNFERSFHYLDLLVQIIETKEHIIKQDLERYARIITNYLTRCASVKRFDKFPPLLAKMRSIKTDDYSVKAMVVQNVYYLELLYRLRLESTADDHQKALVLVPEIEKMLQEYQEDINKSRQLTFYISISTVYLLNEDFEQAQDSNNRIVLLDDRHEIRKDIQLFARILQIIIHFERNDYFFLEEKLIPDLRRWIRTFSNPQTKVRLFLDCIQKAIEPGNKRQQAPLFQRLENQLGDGGGGLQGVLLWLRRKKNQTSLGEIPNRSLKHLEK